MRTKNRTNFLDECRAVFIWCSRIAVQRLLMRERVTSAREHSGELLISAKCIGCAYSASRRTHPCVRTRGARPQSHREHRHHISLIPLPAEILNSPWPPALSHKTIHPTQKGAFDATIDRWRRRRWRRRPSVRPTAEDIDCRLGRPASARAAVGGAGVGARSEFSTAAAAAGVQGGRCCQRQQP